MKNYLLLSLKRKLPLFVILFVIFMIIALISGVNADFVKTLHKDGDGNYLSYYGDSGSSATMGLLVFLFIMMMVLPFFSMNYRYSLSKSDTFRQTVFKDKHIRYGEHISTLLVALASFSLAFITLVIIMMIRNQNVILPKETEYASYELIKLHYIYYLPFYFAIIVLAVIQYFVSYFLISRSNNFLNSLIILFVGQGFLTCIITIIGHFFLPYYNMFSFVGSTACVAFPIAYLYNQFNPLIVNNVNTLVFGVDSAIERANLITFIISSVLFLGVGALGVYTFVYEKDPSSEWANKPGSDKPHQEIIYHMGFGAMGTIVAMSLITTGDSLIWMILFYFLFSATYYTMYGLLNRNFKLKLRETLTLVGVTSLSLIIAIVYFFVYTAQTAA